METIQQSTDHIDILVNNSGCNWGESIHTYPDSAWDKVILLTVNHI